MALLTEYYGELPQPESGPKKSAAWAARLQEGLEKFKSQVQARYTEGTLQRLLQSSDVRARRAAVLALGMVGSMVSNKTVARMLHDDDRTVQHLAVEALWSLWFRSGTEEQVQELRRLVRLEDAAKALPGMNALIKKAPRFAEAYNQRAILYFRLEEYQRSIADCERTLKLNPVHFGAQAGMAQGFMKLQKPRAALRAFKSALRINPNLDGVEETIQFLEDVLGGEGRRDDKK
jgi:tetratricopeptide (TPR) repeat protein